MVAAPRRLDNGFDLIVTMLVALHTQCYGISIVDHLELILRYSIPHIKDIHPVKALQSMLSSRHM